MRARTSNKAPTVIVAVPRVERGLRGRNAFFALFLLLFDHLDLALTASPPPLLLPFPLFVRGAAKAITGMLVADQLHVAGHLEFAQVNGQTDLQLAYIRRNQFGNIFGKPDTLTLNRRVRARRPRSSRPRPRRWSPPAPARPPSRCRRPRGNPRAAPCRSAGGAGFPANLIHVFSILMTYFPL